MQIEEVWFGRSASATIARAALTPASWLYALGWRAYEALYATGIKRAKEPHRPVICVGNLVVGGSGKTPATLAIARTLLAMGETVVLSVSGYGSPRAEGATVARDGPLDAGEWGDEPSMLRAALPDVPLVVGRDRVLAAELAHRQFPTAILLMDDGYQHLPLKKHIAILLDPEPQNARCLPAGPYREPRSRRRAADLVLGERFRLRRARLRFESAPSLPAEAPARAAMLCAIGNPDGFAEALQEAGVEVVKQVRRPDHDPLSGGNLFDGLPPGEPVVVTAKDWAKLRSRGDIGSRNILVAQQDAIIEPEAEFQAWLEARLSQIRTP